MRHYLAQQLRIMLSGDVLIVEYIILLHLFFVLILIETTIKFIYSKVIY